MSGAPFRQARGRLDACQIRVGVRHRSPSTKGVGTGDGHGVLPHRDFAAQEQASCSDSAPPTVTDSVQISAVGVAKEPKAAWLGTRRNEWKYLLCNRMSPPGKESKDFKTMYPAAIVSTKKIKSGR